MISHAFKDIIVWNINWLCRILSCISRIWMIMYFSPYNWMSLINTCFFNDITVWNIIWLCRILLYYIAPSRWYSICLHCHCHFGLSVITWAINHSGQPMHHLYWFSNYFLIHHYIQQRNRVSLEYWIRNMSWSSVCSGINLFLGWATVIDVDISLYIYDTWLCLFTFSATWTPFQYKYHLSRYGNFHYKGEVVMRQFYL